MTDSDKNTNLKRLGWILYDDINRRFNLMIEECRHLQQLVHYYGDFDLSDDKETEPSVSNDSESDEQPEIIDFKATEDIEYQRFSPTQRGLVSLYNHLGGLIIGLKGHKKTVKSNFSNFMRQVTPKTWFWFVASRAHFLHEVLEVHMDLLEHAHEKLIQILETKPGALPQPTLLRRWNSALYGRFLSDYSRHIDWETSVFTNKLRGKPLSDDELRTWRHHTSFIHSWAHTPTSMVSKFWVKYNHADEGTQNYFFGSVRSAFFYLEIPLLYPMLYHECGHLQFDWHKWDKSKNENENKGEFFNLREKIAASLEETAVSFEVNDAVYFKDLTEEIWVDAISIALGGIPFLTALVLQMFGQTVGRYFDTTNEINMADWGVNPVYDEETFSLDEKYFWITRILSAIKAVKHLHENKIDEESKKWLDTIEYGIESYLKGGDSVFSDVSSQHRDYWNYRKEINDWVQSSISVDYERCLDILKRKLDESENRHFPVSRKYAISNELIDDVIVPVIKNYTKKYFVDKNESDQVNSFRLEGIVKLEQLLYYTKWHLSSHVVAKMVDEKVDEYVNDFADYIRSDGTAIFRISLEWIMARNELYTFFADYLSDKNIISPHIEKLERLGSSNSEEIKKLTNCIKKIKEEIDKIFPTQASNEQESNELLAKALYYHWPLNDKNYIGRRQIKKQSKEIQELIELINKFIDQFMEIIVTAQFKKIHVNERTLEASLGTFTLGAISHREFRKYGYRQSINKVYSYFTKSHNHMIEKKREFIRELENNDISESQDKLNFLMGDYDFMNYEDGVTPGEYSFHPYHSPAILVKPRAVLDLHKPMSEIKTKHCRVSLLKFRYRWEIYCFEHMLSNKNYRYYLSLSSAWEDAVLVGWEKDKNSFLGERTSAEDNESVNSEYDSSTGCGSPNMVDSQTNIVLFKMKNSKDNEILIHSMDDKEIDQETEITVDEKNSTDLMKVLTNLFINNEIKTVEIFSGRSDFSVTWVANDTQKMAETLFKLPAAFWKHVSHMRSSYFINKKSLINASEADEFGFRSRISGELFHSIENKKAKEK